MRIKELFTDYNIPFQTEGHKHCRPGWVNVECPFCEGNPGLHLGYNEEGDYFTCWRCGFHHTNDVLKALLSISHREAKRLMREYRGRSKISNTNKLFKNLKRKKFKYPSGCSKMNKVHKAYLAKRNFDPDKLEQEWNLMGTGPVSILDKKDYKHRIIIPIVWNNEVVSFQGRDITGKTKVRYKACPKDREVIEHQTILYGNQNQWDDIGICVEGVTDVWRLGFKSFAVFGISYTSNQVKCIVKHFKRVVILFDDDPQAQKQANKLQAELKFRGIRIIKETIKGDPGDLKQDDADYLVKQLTKRFY